MAITTGPNLGLLIGAAAGEAHYDELQMLLRGLDALVQCHVKTVGTNTPAASPTNGDCHIVGSAPTGAWAGKANQIARWNGSTWEFLVPKNGWSVIYETGQVEYRYNGTAWAVASSGSASVQNYSTTEQNTGVKDVNGYDIYWKTVDCGTLPNNTTKFVNHGITNLRRFVDGRIAIRKADNSSIVFTQLVYPTNATIGFGAYATATQIAIVTGADRTDHTGEAYLWYTKTV